MGLVFNFLQLVGLYSHYLSYKKNKEQYNIVGWIYIISVLVGIVDYRNVLTIVLFFVQILAFIAFPAKKSKS